jgi:acyl phosphate:glycerol-3-phosphate acyltransferase
MSTFAIIGLVFLIIVSYFIGNISFAIIFSRSQKKDITKIGSGNPGTMNMLRTFGVKFGVLTLVCDALKASIPSLIGFLVFGQFGDVFGVIALYSAGLAVVLGHMFPIVRKFKGGKGMASALGVFIVADPLWTLIVFVIAFLYLYFFDYGAVASFIVLAVMATMQAIFANSLGELAFVVQILIFCLFALVFFAHRTNIKRMLIGKESKVNLKRSLKKLGMKKTLKEAYKDKKDEKKRDIG